MSNSDVPSENIIYVFEESTIKTVLKKTPKISLFDFETSERVSFLLLSSKSLSIIKMKKGAVIDMPELETIKRIVSEYADKYGADRVILFGSYARGDMTENSDIDLLIDKGSIKGLKFAALLCDLEEALQVPVDLISTRGASEDFLQSIKKDEVLLYERG